MQGVSYLPKRIHRIHLRCKAQGLVAGHLQGCSQAFLGKLAVISIGHVICLVGTQLLRCILVLLLLRRACILLLCVCTGPSYQQVHVLLTGVHIMSCCKITADHAAIACMQ